MRRAQPDPTASDWLSLVGVIAVFAAWFLATQPVISGGIGNDGGQYLEMATRIERGEPPQGPQPFVMRVGTPILAASLSRLADVPIPRAFFLINFAAATCAALAFAFWVRRRGAGRVHVLVAVSFLLAMPYSPFRFTFFYPVLGDAVAMLCVIAGLICLDAIRRSDNGRPLVVATLLVAIGCAFREVVMVLAVAVLFVRPFPRTINTWLLRAVPILAGLLTISLVRMWVIILPSPYAVVATMLYFLKWKTAAQMVLAILLVCGPALVLTLDQWRNIARDISERLDLVAFVAAFFVLGWLSATDTERIFAFAAPVLLMCEAVAAARLQPIALGGVVVVQLVFYRVWSAIGAPEQFFSFFMPRQALISWLAISVGSALVVGALSRFRVKVQ